LEQVQEGIQIVSENDQILNEQEIRSLRSLIISAQNYITNIKNSEVLSDINQRFRDGLDRITNFSSESITNFLNPFLDSTRQTLSNVNVILVGIADIISKTVRIVNRIINLNISEIVAQVRPIIIGIIVTIIIAYFWDF